MITGTLVCVCVCFPETSVFLLHDLSILLSWLLAHGGTCTHCSHPISTTESEYPGEGAWESL